MSRSSRFDTRSRLLAISLIIYSLCFFLIDPRKGDLDLIRIPAFSLLLLVLIQVIFPQFKLSTTANLIAILIILGFPLFNTILS